MLKVLSEGIYFVPYPLLVSNMVNILKMAWNYASG